VKWQLAFSEFSPLPISQFLFPFLKTYKIFLLFSSSTDYREPHPPPIGIRSSLILPHFLFSSFFFFMAHAPNPNFPPSLFSSSTNNLTSPLQSPSFLFPFFFSFFFLFPVPGSCLSSSLFLPLTNLLTLEFSFIQKWVSNF
jgi:hypothetical protein